MIRTCTNPVEYGALKLRAKLLVIVLVERNALLRPIDMFNEKLNLLVRHRKADVNNIAQRHIVDRKDLIPRHKPQLIGKASLRHAKNYSWICLCHIPLPFSKQLFQSTASISFTPFRYVSRAKFTSSPDWRIFTSIVPFSMVLGPIAMRTG